MGFIVGTIATAITFAIVAYVLPGIDYQGDVISLLILAVIAGLINGLVRPIIAIFSLPLTFMTLGLFGLVINAAMLLLVALVASLAGIDFSVGGFPSAFGLGTIIAALIGAVAISIVGGIVGLVIHD